MAENILEQHGFAMLLQKREKLSDIIISQTLSVMSIVAVSVCPVIIICGPEDYLLLYIMGIFFGPKFCPCSCKKDIFKRKRHSPLPSSAMHTKWLLSTKI